MRASHLKSLASVAEAAKMDLAPGPLTIAPDEAGGIIAWYQGAYSACGIAIDVPDVLTAPVSVAAREFQSLAGLFEDDTEVALRVDKSSLLIASRQRKLSLRFQGKPSVDGYQVLRDTPPIVTTKLSELTREMVAASQCVSTTMSQPVLTGVRIIASDNALGLQAANASSIVFTVAMKCEASDKFEIVAGASDIVMALRTLTGEQVSIGKAGRTLVLKTENAMIKIPTLSGLWPNIQKPLKALVYHDACDVPIESIKSLISAAKAYRAANDVVLIPTERGVSIETIEGELGQFQEEIEGTLSRRYVLDIADLDTAARMSDDVAHLQFSDSFVLMTAGPRRLYMLLRLSA